MVKVRFVCISDTHNAAPGEGYTLPAGNVLIHAGDLTNQGSYKELQKAAQWLAKSDFEAKIVVAGNHDLLLDENYCCKHAKDLQYKDAIRDIPGITYLEHSSASVHLPSLDVSFTIFGSPLSRADSSVEWAFQYPPNKEDMWDAIGHPDIIITHMPPAGYNGLDASSHWTDGGCRALSEALQRIKPLLHVCGHCHEGRGARVLRWTNGVESGDNHIENWVDPGESSKKLSRLDLRSLQRSGGDSSFTAVVNASIRAQSWSQGGHRGPAAFNKPIVVDLDLS